MSRTVASVLSRVAPPAPYVTLKNSGFTAARSCTTDFSFSLPTAAQAFVERIAARRPVVAVDKDIVLDALALRHRHYLSHWDAAVLCAAQRLGAHTVISEDMEHGRDYGGVTVINPFLQGPPFGPLPPPT